MATKIFSNPTSNPFELLADENLLQEVSRNRTPKKQEPSGALTPAEKAKVRAEKKAAKEEKANQSTPPGEKKGYRPKSRKEWEASGRPATFVAPDDGFSRQGRGNRQVRGPRQPAPSNNRQAPVSRGYRKGGPEKRPNKRGRNKERESGMATGNKPFGKKQGAGKANWGKQGESATETVDSGAGWGSFEAERTTPQGGDASGWGEDVTTPVEPDNDTPGETPAETVEENSEEELLTLDDYLKKKAEETAKVAALVGGSTETSNPEAETSNVTESKGEEADKAPSSKIAVRKGQKAIDDSFLAFRAPNIRTGSRKGRARGKGGRQDRRDERRGGARNKGPNRGKINPREDYNNQFPSLGQN
jgi:hypothetical protein